MDNIQDSKTLSLKWLIIILAICLAPTLILMASGQTTFSGKATYIILQSASFCVALFIALLSFIQFARSGEVSTPVLGLGMLCVGIMDLWQTIVIANNPEVSQEYIHLTWTFSRSFYAIVLMSAATVSPMFEKVRGTEERRKGAQIALGCGLVFALIGAGVMGLLASDENLVASLYNNGLTQKVLMYAPLVLLAIAAAYVLPTFNMWHRNGFSQILIVSCIPLLIAQAHFAFGPADSLFAPHFGTANLLKLLGYLVPLVGLVADYESTYHRIEETNRNLNRKLFELEQGKGVSHQHDSFFDALMNHLTSPVCFVDTSLKCTRINGQMALIAGMGLGTKPVPLLAIGRELEKVLGDQVGPVAKASIEWAISSNATVTIDPESYTYKDGKAHTYGWTFHPITNDEKRVVAIACVGHAG